MAKSVHLPKPIISVIIPAYNHESYLQETIFSVLEQTVTNFELIIINDGSKDKTEDIVMGICDERINYLYQSNQGAHNAINRGIKLAKGDYISILNSDDVYALDRFEKCLKQFDHDPSIQAVFSHVQCIDQDGKNIRYHAPKDGWINHHSDNSFKNDNKVILDLLVGNFLLTTSNLFCKKEVFNQIGFFASYRYAHDYDFFLRLCYHLKIKIIEEPLLKYRLHPKNTIKENEAAQNFEVGLILSNFFLNYDLSHIFPEDDCDTLLTKFFNSVRMCQSERMIMTLLLFAMKYKSRIKIENLLKISGTSFRNACMEYFQKQIDNSKELQIEREKTQELNDKLIDNLKKLQIERQKSQELNDKLIDNLKKLQIQRQRSQELNDKLNVTEKKLAKERQKNKGMKVISQNLLTKLYQSETYTK